jgi:hypothetical protein
VPTSSDAVLFDAASVGACTLDVVGNAASLTMASGSLGSFAFGTNSLTVAGNADLRSGGAFTGSTGGLVMGASGTLTPPGATTIPSLTVSTGTTTLATNDLSLAGNLTLSGGVLNANGRNLNVAGNWANSGTFTAGAGTVTLNGSGAQAISGSTTFNNLTAACTTARTLTFTAGTTQTVAGALSLNGIANQLLSLRSSAAAVWKIDPQGTRSCSYLDVQWGENLRKPVIGPTNSTDSLNNTWWFTEGLSITWGTGTTGAAAGTTGDLNWNLGNLVLGQRRTTHGAGADARDFSVANASDVRIRLTASAATGPDWGLAGSAGAEACVVGINTDNSATYSSLHAGGVLLSGGMALGAEQAFDLSFTAPSSTAHLGVPQTMTVTVTATAE